MWPSLGWAPWEASRPWSWPNAAFLVCGLNQSTPPRGRGSHSGSTRIYRVAYPEGSGYVPLTQLAGTLWDQAAEQMGSKLLHRTGVLYMGPPEDSFLREVADSASTHHLQVESFTVAE